MSPAVVLGTRNAGKLRELRPLFAAAGIEVLDLVEAGHAVEDQREAEVEAFATFEENALAKARYFHAITARACAADDSGLEVVALGGRPGVRSRRWAEDEGVAGPDESAANNAVLVRSLAGVQARSARFVCAAAFCDGDREFTASGVVDGEITEVARGRYGFGYDPYFFVTAIVKTLAEAMPAEKAAVSHRARAFELLIRRIRAGN